MKLAQDLGYQFQKHALDKVKAYQQDLDKLNKHNNRAVQSQKDLLKPKVNFLPSCEKP